MKAVILAGGFGTRLSEETDLKPKPMIEIGGKPILWHIMKIYAYYGINDFIICCGYKADYIKDYFRKFSLIGSDFTINTKSGDINLHNSFIEDWKVTIVDTGLKTMTGGRLRRIKEFLNSDEDFCFTYGDGLADVDISKLIKFHQNHGKMATVTSVKPAPRFGALKTEGDFVIDFSEKSKLNESLINGGFFVLKPDVIELITSDEITWEQEPLSNLSKRKQLMHFYHDGFWQPMDTLREKRELEKLWQNNIAPWKMWK